MLKDLDARTNATDPRHSFIVQAPAGSGKTELLTQRYLRLLSTVTSPEQIVALTFTKKAAGEMKARILLALMDAEQNLPLESSHQQLTRVYAEKALNHSQSLHWQLLQNPERMKIMTIDSLCQSLRHAIPLYEQQIPYAPVSNTPDMHYQKAVRDFLNYLFEESDWQPYISQLLEHLDNRQDHLIELLCYLLSTREQWLTLIYKARFLSKTDFEQAIQSIETQALNRFIEATPKAYREELQTITREMASIENDEHSPRHALQAWDAFLQINKEIAASLAALLFTKEDKIRKSFDHHVGLARKSCHKLVYDTLKARSKDLLESLDKEADFKASLLRIKNLPPPLFEPAQWQVLQALLKLLPILVAHLQLVFAEANEVDFTAISHQALLALGDDDEPTDLALFMDNAIHHLLVDEFQDTSIQQFQLISKLVQGWQPEDGKTLFVVGDPMQSIYRFRQAEVGLFLKARLQGIGAIALTPLYLCCNFRSNQPLVDWVNKQFKNIFPGNDDIASGAISFHPSVATSEEREDNSEAAKKTLIAQQFKNSKEEAEALAKLVKSQLENYPEDNIAILVRSRNQLSEIIPCLRANNISFQGIEIEKLSNLPHLRDIWSITKSLLLPGDRLPWLAVLRSPWCGIGLADLHAIANYNPKESIYYALSELNEIKTISEEGRIRATFFFQVMHQAILSRAQLALADWLSTVLRDLQGEKILKLTEQKDLEQFFILLARFTKAGQLIDIQQFEQQFQKLYSQRISQSRLQIMTIHKSKGLEFDTVILPGLGSKAATPDKPLLRWLSLPSSEGTALLISPIHAKHQEKCPLYDYLGEISLEKEQYEQQRLLYVAVTRAKKRLYLMDGHEKIRKESFRDLLGNEPFEASIGTDSREQEEEADTSVYLSRLGLSHYPKSIKPGHYAISNKNTNPLPELINPKTRIIGIASHELLAWICNTHTTSEHSLPWGMVVNRLKSAGFTENEQKVAKKLIETQIHALLQDPIGQWICSTHEDEHNEYELVLQKNNETITRIIDRTFIDKDHRWIIDFKTGAHSAKAETKHRKQVNEYASILSTQNQPIRCGLYYLTGNHWVQWDAAEPSAIALTNTLSTISLAVSETL